MDNKITIGEMVPEGSMDPILVIIKKHHKEKTLESTAFTDELKAKIEAFATPVWREKFDSGFVTYAVQYAALKMAKLI